MNSLLAMYIEVRYQLEDLTVLNLSSPGDPQNSLFVGSGDSHAAALVAEYASNHRAKSCYPTDILTNPEILNERTAYFISISGNTLDNIAAARMAKRKGIKTVAITREPRSKLAAICDELIELKYRRTGITTSGSIGFSTSLLTCFSLVRSVNCIPNLTSLIEDADMISWRLLQAQQFTSYIIMSSGLLFPIAVYGALKINEILGVRSYAYTIDEFFHAPIFGITETDRLIAIDSRDSLSRIRLPRSGSIGLNLSTVDLDYPPAKYLTMLFLSLFTLQLFVIKTAVRQGLKECSFLTNQKTLEVSSNYIYA
ncbi:MAG TPA: SIS domain-containing protein [Nitrososphaeraceae archaeon]|jgi:fructoselysine-6-P-deglycase FrlB-like protein